MPPEGSPDTSLMHGDYADRDHPAGRVGIECDALAGTQEAQPGFGEGRRVEWDATARIEDDLA